MPRTRTILRVFGPPPSNEAHRLLHASPRRRSQGPTAPL